MNTSFATVIHCAPKLDIKELMIVRKSLSSILAPEFVRECDSNYDLINPVVSKPESASLTSKFRWPKTLTLRSQRTARLSCVWST